MKMIEQVKEIYELWDRQKNATNETFNKRLVEVREGCLHKRYKIDGNHVLCRDCNYYVMSKKAYEIQKFINGKSKASKKVEVLLNKFKKDKKQLNKILGIAIKLNPKHAIMLMMLMKQSDKKYMFTENLIHCENWGKLAERTEKFLF